MTTSIHRVDTHLTKYSLLHVAEVGRSGNTK